MSLWRVKAHELRAAQARQIADIARETADQPTTLTRAHIGHRSPAGDEQRLRGIPVTGARGVTGTMPGTQPHAALR